jgi:hypothetical protein
MVREYYIATLLPALCSIARNEQSNWKWSTVSLARLQAHRPEFNIINVVEVPINLAIMVTTLLDMAPRHLLNLMPLIRICIRGETARGSQQRVRTCSWCMEWVGGVSEDRINTILNIKRL